MTESELSEKLGGMQRKEAVCILAALLGGIGCAAVLLISQNIPVAALLFAVSAAGIAAGSAIRKKRKTLLQEQLAGFFQSELEAAFGPDLHTPEMRIDRTLMEKLGLPCGEWEECGIGNFHEGMHGGILFSAANVRLEHVRVVRQAREGTGTYRETVFGGIVFRIRTSASPSAPVCIIARTEGGPQGLLTGNAAFDSRFCITGEQGEPALPAAPLAESLETFLQSVNGRVTGMRWEDGIFTAALETRYGFAVVSDDVNQGDLAAVRRSYLTSLREMGRMIDLFIKNPVLFGGRG